MTSFRRKSLKLRGHAQLGRRKFLKLAIQPNIVVLQDVRFGEKELEDYMAEVGRDLFTADLRETLGQFEQAKNFGSLIQPALKDPAEVRRVLKAKGFEGNLFLSGTHQKVLSLLHMAEALSPQYHVVVANPPYMGSKGMNSVVVAFAKKKYPDSKADLFGMFMERCLSLSHNLGFIGILNLPSWMFLSSFEKLRGKILEASSIRSLLHLGRGLFGSDFGTVAFCLQKTRTRSETRGVFRRLFEKRVDVRRPDVIESLFLDPEYGRFFARTGDFKKIPGDPIVYWISDRMRNTFSENACFGDYATPAVGQNTGDNDRFLREWSEISNSRIGFNLKSIDDVARSGKKWFPYNKGGPFRKWYGNAFLVVNWENDGEEIKSYAVERNNGKHWSRYIQNLDKMLKSGVSWSTTSSSFFGIRYVDDGFFFDVQGTSAISDTLEPELMAAFLCTKMVARFLDMLNPTIVFQARDIRNLPFVTAVIKNPGLLSGAKTLIQIARSDWDAYETSWDFTTLPLLSIEHRGPTPEATYARLRAHWQSMTDEMKNLEEENNRIFIEAYGLQDELSPEVPIQEVTLTCNPAFRYGIKISEEDREQRLRADTMAEFLFYAVGCMFGRYSLDKPGLVLANQGETLSDYLAQVPEPSFLPDEDNVVPILDADWFTDDITERFREFLRLTFGDKHFQENVEFIEQALGKPVRKYFLKDFYKDHVKRYKKRPIYWLFSSPKGSFNALIYMHRYRPDTVSVILNEYLREFVTKLGARIQQLEQIEASASTSARDKTAALKEIKQLRDTLAELEDWERKVLLPLATERITIDLDDGVKANYPKFGPALAKIPGLSE